MPTYEIQTPNGSTYEVESPDQNSALAAMGQLQKLRQAEAALRKADAAGNNDDARRLAGAIRTMRAKTANESLAEAGMPPEVRTTPKQDRLGYFSAADEADAYEMARGTGTFTDATDSAMRGIPFSDEIVSVVGAPFRAASDWMAGKGFDVGRAYDEKMQVEAELQRRRDERSPIASTVAPIASGIAVAAPVAKAGWSLLQGAKPTLTSLVGRGAAEGAGWGAVYGAGEGRGIKRLKNAMHGLGVGAAAGAAGEVIARAGGNKVNIEGLPTIDDLKSTAADAYKRADDAGGVYTSQGVARIRDALEKQFAEFGYHPDLQRGAKVAFGEVDRIAGNGNVSLKGLDTARKIAGNAYDPTNKSNNALTAKVVDAIDNLVENPQAGDVLMDDSGLAANAIKEGREAYSRSRKLETVEALLKRAGLNAGSSGSGGNIENATRQQLKQLLTNRSMMRGFSSEEIAAVEKAVLGSPAQNALRLVGKLSPEGSGLMAMLHLLGGSSTSGATLPLAGIGFAAKRGSEAITRNRARLVEAIIASGGKLPEPQVSGKLKAVADAMMRAGAIPSY